MKKSVDPLLHNPPLLLLLLAIPVRHPPAPPTRLSTNLGPTLILPPVILLPTNRTATQRPTSILLRRLHPAEAKQPHLCKTLPRKKPSQSLKQQVHIVITTIITIALIGLRFVAVSLCSWPHFLRSVCLSFSAPSLALWSRHHGSTHTHGTLSAWASTGLSPLKPS